MRASLLSTPASILALLGAVVVSACSSSGTTGASGSSSSGGGSGGSGGGGSGGSSGSAGGSGGSSGGSQPPLDAAAPDGDVSMSSDASVGTDSYTVQFGPIQVTPGQENTQCIVVRLHNAAPIHVGQIHDLLGTASHHMILYKVNDTAEQTTPFNCTPFQNTLNPAAGNPLIISQRPDDTLALPQGVAYSLDANQMVRLEMHYINANPSQTVTLVTTSTLTTIPAADYKYDASFLFIGTSSINLPPNATASTGPQYFAVPSQFASSNFFAITGHEHHLGTKVQIWSAAGASDPGSQIYTSTSWSDPPVTPFTPPMRVPAGGGFKYQCDWNNTTSSSVSFGESANDEMCFFWAYYFPSQGAEVCFSDRGFCCPSSDPAVAAFCSAL